MSAASTVASTGRSDRPPLANAPGGEDARAAQLRAANIDPRTGLATDYLNHFNEAIMLLEMVPDMPECAEDFLNWQPLSYREHFMASNFSARELAIEAYESADGALRDKFDYVTSKMTLIIEETGAAIRKAPEHAISTKLPTRAAGRLKALVALAGGLINDGNADPDVDYIMSGHEPLMPWSDIETAPG